MGVKITQDTIDQFEGDASRFIVAIRPEVNLAEKIKYNTENEEIKEERKLDRISKRLYAGEFLFEQGEDDKIIYILMEGVVEVFFNGSLVAEIKEKGAFIGEMSIIMDRPRSATIKAQTDCLFYCIDGSDLLILAQNYPVVLARMCKSLANKVAQTSSELSLLKLSGVANKTRVINKPIHESSRFLQNIGQYKDKILTFEKNVKLFEEGEMTFDMYILVKGEVRVSIGGEAIVRISAPGTLLGEMSSLRVKPRSATVTTMMPSEFLRVQGLRLMETCQEDPQFLVKLAQILAGRLVETSAEYAHHIKSSEI